MDERTAAARPPHAIEPSELPRVGRYVVLSRLGSGAMGVVYAAHDPTLDRKVALKLLRPDVVGEPDAAAARSRLVREAQAMARLSHPNVIPVHDVGVEGGQPYFSMELVEGTTLAQWVAGGSRGWEAILEAYMQAGRGLAAAHAAGLVHRDFKPENVLRRGDGRVLVTDFGLARAAGDADGVGPAAERPSSTAATVMRGGALLGTPACMAPEQLEGEPATAASDQYSFAVALYGALHGRAPAARRRGRRMPARLRNILERGMSREPGGRFPSLDAMLAALEGVRRRRRRAILAAAAAFIAAGATVAASTALSGRGPVCRPADERLNGVWDGARKAAVKRAFDRTRAPYAGDAWRKVGEVLDGYGRTWVASHTRTCEATWVRREQSDELLDLRMGCLTERLGELAALVDVLSEADATAVERATAAVLGLAAPSSCEASVATLRARVPADPAVRQRVAALRADLDRAAAMRAAGRLADAYAVATPAAAAAGRLGFRAFEADALLLQGGLEVDLARTAEAEATLERAALAGEAGRNDEAAAGAWISLASAVGYDQSRLEEGRRLQGRAAAAVERLGGNPRIEARLDHVRARIALRAGDYAGAAEAASRASASYRRLGDAMSAARVDSTLGTILARLGRTEEADARHRSAVETTEAIVGSSHPEVARRLVNRAAFALETSRFADAARWNQLAIDIFEKTLGPSHPDLAAPLTGLATALAQLGHPDEALEPARRALAVREAIAAQEPVEYAQTLQNLAAHLGRLGRPAEALGYFRRALEAKEKALGHNHESVARTVRNIAVCLTQLGDDAGARPLLTRNLTILEAAFGSRHDRVANALVELALVALRSGDARTARSYGERASDMLASLHGAGAVEVAEPLVVIGRARLALADPQGALAPLERAVALLEGDEAEAEELAQPRFWLAMARWQLRRDRAGARSRAAAAVRDFAGRADLSFDAVARGDLARMKAWLGGRDGPQRGPGRRRTGRPRATQTDGAGSR